VETEGLNPRAAISASTTLQV